MMFLLVAQITQSICIESIVFSGGKLQSMTKASNLQFCMNNFVRLTITPTACVSRVKV